MKTCSRRAGARAATNPEPTLRRDSEEGVDTAAPLHDILRPAANRGLTPDLLLSAPPRSSHREPTPQRAGHDSRESSERVLTREIAFVASMSRSEVATHLPPAAFCSTAAVRRAASVTLIENRGFEIERAHKPTGTVSCRVRPSGRVGHEHR